MSKSATASWQCRYCTREATLPRKRMCAICAASPTHNGLYFAAGWQAGALETAGGPQAPRTTRQVLDTHSYMCAQAFIYLNGVEAGLAGDTSRLMAQRNGRAG